MDADDLIFYSEGESIYSGGFKVNSVLLKNGMSPLYTVNNGQNGGGNNVSDLFKDLAIPSGLLYLPTKMNGGNFDHNTDEKDSETCEDNEDYVSEDIHDKLLSLVSVENKNKNKNSRKKKQKNSNKNTKRI